MSRDRGSNRRDDGVRIGVTGATGRMGRAVLDAASAREDVAVAFAVARSAAPGDRDAASATGRNDRDAASATGRNDRDAASAVDRDAETVAGVPVAPAADLDRLLGERDPDALVDFTAPASSVEYVAAAADAGVASVVGTTGFDDEGERALRAAAERAPVLTASNFGRGVQALLSAVEAAVAALPGYDAEVTETHHAGKRDAPSGTAKTILDTIESAREASSRDDASRAAGGADAGRGPNATDAEGSDATAAGERVHGREGEALREPDEIGVHARRAGTITGEHEVLLAGNHEEVCITHRAGDRGVFAEGALDAAGWLAGREPGWYDFADAVEEDA